MRVKRLWAALAVPMVFDLVRDASGAFIATARANAALVFGVALGVVMPVCFRQTVCVVCRTLETVASLFWSELSPRTNSSCKVAPGKDSPRGLSPREDSPREVSPREDFPRGLSPRKDFPCKVCCSVPCTLKTFASLFWLGTLGSAPCIDVVFISCVRLRISCSCCAVTNALCFRTLARSDMAFMILYTCDKDGFVMFLCLKCTVSDNLSLWAGLM